MYVCICIYIVQAVDTAQFVDTLYSWSAFNTEEIGRIIGTGLNELCTNNAYSVGNIHLIGIQNKTAKLFEF